AGPHLVRHIDLRGRVLAHEDDGEPRNRAGALTQRLEPLPAFLPDACRNVLAVDDPGAHVTPSKGGGRSLFEARTIASLARPTGGGARRMRTLPHCRRAAAHPLTPICRIRA